MELAIAAFKVQLKKHFKTKLQSCSELTYTGSRKQDYGHRRVSQEECLKSIPERFDIEISRYTGRASKTPGTMSAFTLKERNGDDEQLSDIVMSIV